MFLISLSLFLFWILKDFHVINSTSVNHHQEYYDGINEYYVYPNGLTGSIFGSNGSLAKVRSQPGIRRANIQQRQRTIRPAVVATFRFEQKPTAGKKSGWHVSGCYCPASSVYCDCSRATTRVNMMINPRRVPRPSTGKKATIRNPTRSQTTKRIVRYRERVRGKNGGVRTKPLSIRSGCFCDSLGCRGNACNQLNGCVCNDDNGICWGNNCPASRSVNTDRSLDSPVETGIMENLMATPPSITPVETPSNGLLVDPLFNLFNLANNSSSMKISDEIKTILPSENIAEDSVADLTDGCYCDQMGCKGSNCSQMNGCFCGLDQCWGRSCGLLSPLGSGQPTPIEDETVFSRKKFGYDDNLLDGKVTMVKSKFENLWNSKKNMMTNVGNKFGGLVGSKVNMVQSKLNGIAGTKASIINSVGNQLTDLVAHKTSMSIPNKFNFLDGIGNKPTLTMNEILTSSDQGPIEINNSPILTPPSPQPPINTIDSKMNKIYSMKAPSESKSSNANNNNNRELIMMMMKSNGKNKKPSNLLTVKHANNDENDLQLTAKTVANGDAKFETVLGNKVDVLTGKVNNLVTADAKGMKNLVGQVIPVIRGFPIESIVGVPVPQIQGMAIGSVPSMPVETKPQKPKYHHHHHHQNHHNPNLNLNPNPNHNHNHNHNQHQQLVHHHPNHNYHHHHEPQPHPYNIMSPSHPPLTTRQLQPQLNNQNNQQTMFNNNHLTTMNVDVSSSKPAGVATLNPIISRLSDHNLNQQQHQHQQQQQQQQLPNQQQSTLQLQQLLPSQLHQQQQQQQKSNQPTVIIRASPNGSVPSVTIKTIELPQSGGNITKSITMVN